jgi:hypothetical protein
MIFKTQKEMLLWIWGNRPHVSELTGEPLLPKGHYKWYWQFLHVLSKQAYPSYKFESDNIILALPEEHEKQEDYEYFRNKRDELKLRYNTDPNIKH